MRKIKKNKASGITLIALVITIIVLLILAGISIQMLTGDNGILNRAGEAKEKSITGEEKDNIALAWNSLIGKKVLEGKDITDLMLENELNNSGKNVKVDNLGNAFSITFKDTNHEYIVDKNGNIVLLGENTYAVTLNANGGKYSDNNTMKIKTLNKDQKLGAIENPTRDGCEFLGWYKNVTKKEEVDGQIKEYIDREYIDISSETEFTENTTLYARWRKYLYNEGVGSENWIAFQRREDFSWSPVSYYCSFENNYVEFGDNSESSCGCTGIKVQNNDISGFTKLYGIFSCYSNNRDISSNWVSSLSYNYFLGMRNR